MKSLRISLIVVLAVASAVHAAKIQFSEKTYRLVEGDEQPVTALVELTDCPTRAPLGSVAVRVVATDASAHEGADYFAFSEFELGSQPPPPGSRLGRVYKTQEVPMHVVDDDEEESDETFYLGLVLDPDAKLDCGSGPEPLQLGEQAAVTIVSNDERTSRVEFEDVDTIVREGDGATKVIGRARVRRIGGTTGAEVTCISEADGSATVRKDYVPVRQKLSWKAGQMEEKFCEVEILNDDLVEGEESLRLSLVDPSRGVTLGAQSSAMLKIEDDDDAGQVAFAAVEYTATEGEGEAEVVIARKGGTDGAISVDYFARSGSAREEEDFAPARGRLLWEAGDSTPKKIRLQILDDDSVEKIESFTLSLSAPSGGATLGDFANAVVVVGDNDGGESIGTALAERTERRPSTRPKIESSRTKTNTQPSPPVEVSRRAPTTPVATRPENVVVPRASVLRISDAVITEGDSGIVNAMFKVTLTPAADREVTVEFATVDDSATIADHDYVSRSGRFRFGPGQTWLRFNVQVLGDGVAEGDQTFHVQLSNAVGAELSDPRGDATIRDDDAPRAEGEQLVARRRN